MTQLSESTWHEAAADRPDYDRAQCGIGIVHFGPGAFHRAHQAYYTDKAVAIGGGNWGICGVSLNSRGAAEALTPQNGLYTLAVKDKAPNYRIIGCLKEVLCAKDNSDLVFERLTAKTTFFVTLTITEKGYALSPTGELDLSNAAIANDILSPRSPVSAIGYLVEACRRRHIENHAPLTLISCDNLPENGEKLKTACLEFARQIDSDLADYIETSIRFPSTMVDSITPASDAALFEDVKANIGLTDHGAVQREQFTQWVIEDNLPLNRPAWVRAGVIITPDVKAFEKTKLRILNGAHITLTYLGLLLGLDTVEDAINHPKLSLFVDRLIEQESIPTIQPPQGLDLKQYWSATKARFENPHIRHLLEQISHDGSQKIPARIFPVIQYYQEQNKLSPFACFVVSAWIEFNRRRRLNGTPPVDGYLSQVDTALPDTSLKAGDYAKAFIELKGLFPDDISTDKACCDMIISGCKALADTSAILALESIINE
jgi:fructuronate reductase